MDGPPRNVGDVSSVAPDEAADQAARQAENLKADIARIAMSLIIVCEEYPKPCTPLSFAEEFELRCKVWSADPIEAASWIPKPRQDCRSLDDQITQANKLIASIPYPTLENGEWSVDALEQYRDRLVDHADVELKERLSIASLLSDPESDHLRVSPSAAHLFKCVSDLFDRRIKEQDEFRQRCEEYDAKMRRVFQRWLEESNLKEFNERINRADRRYRRYRRRAERTDYLDSGPENLARTWAEEDGEIE
jgi:hypothetical protein